MMEEITVFQLQMLFSSVEAFDVHDGNEWIFDLDKSELMTTYADRVVTGIESDLDDSSNTAVLNIFLEEV